MRRKIKISLVLSVALLLSSCGTGTSEGTNTALDAQETEAVQAEDSADS